MAEERQTPSIDTLSLMRSFVGWRGADLGTLIRLSTKRGVAVVELHDPERFNTMGSALGYDMIRAIDQLSRLGGIHAITLQGAGTTFCAGGNPYGSSGLTSISASSQALLASVQGFVDVRARRLPVVSAVHGAMIGGAAAIFLHADLRIAETEATFQHGNLSRRVCPVAGYSRTLVAAIGARYALRYYLTDQRVIAARALMLGLVYAIRTGVHSAKESARHVAECFGSQGQAVTAARCIIDARLLNGEAVAHVLVHCLPFVRAGRRLCRVYLAAVPQCLQLGYVSLNPLELLRFGFQPRLLGCWLWLTHHFNG